MIFIALMSLTTAGIAGVAAYFSVYGLAHTFSASFWSVVFMGSSLEAGKLMTTSFLYRFKDTLSWRLKIPAMAFIIALMLLTSVGIYGYLSAAYQADTIGMKQGANAIELKREEQKSLQTRKEDIDKQISQLPSNDVRGKQKLMTQFGPEVTKINDRLSAITTEIQSLSQAQISTDAHVGPIVFIAKMIGADADKATSILILLIIFAFDPLAILLTIFTNLAIADYKAKKDVVKDVREETTIPQFIPRTEEQTQEYLNRIRKELAQRSIPLEASNIVASPEDIDLPSEVIAKDYPELASVPMESLQRSFLDHTGDDVELEDGIPPLQGPNLVQVVDPIEEINDIYQDVISKQVEQQTPVDKETASMIERFFARQKLVKQVRTGNLNQ